MTVADLERRSNRWALQDDAVLALLLALHELDGGLSRAWSPSRAEKHPRIPKGQPGAGRFRSAVDQLKDAIQAHARGGKEGHPLDAFNREQLRRVAKARGIALKRGEGRDSIADKLLAHFTETPAHKGAETPHEGASGRPSTWEELGRPQGPAPVGQVIGHEGGTYERLPGEHRRYRVISADGRDISDQMYGASDPSRNQTADDARTALRVDAHIRDRADADASSKWRKTLGAVTGSWSYETKGIEGFDAASPDERQNIQDALARWTGDKANLRDVTRLAEPRVNMAIRGAAERTATVEQDIRALDKAFSLSRTKRSITVYRGYSNGSHILPADWQERDLTGLEWSADGYTPTSGDETVAAEYVGFAKDRGFAVRLKLPKGSPAIAITDAVGGDDNEGEIVLPRGLTFQVVKDSGAQGEQGSRWLDVKLIAEPRAPLAVERRYDPGQLRDPDGKWGDGVPGPSAVLGRLRSEDGLDLEVSAPGDGSATLRFPYPDDAGRQFDGVTLSPESVAKLKSELGDLEPARKAYAAKVQAAARRIASADEGTPEYTAANAAWWQIAGDDQVIGEGSAPGGTGGTLHWALTMGEDEPTFSVAIKPPDAGSGWNLAVEASDGTGGHFPASAAAKLRKQLDKVAGEGVARRGTQQPRDHDGRWTDGTPGPDLPGMNWDEVYDTYGDEYDEAQASDFTVAVFEGGDFALFYNNEHGRHEAVRDLDGDYATELADELDRFADAAEDFDPADAISDGLVDYAPLGDGDAYVGYDNAEGVRLLVSKDGGPIADPDSIPEDGDDQVEVYHLTPDDARQLAEGTRQMLDRYDELDGGQEAQGATRAHSQESGPKYQAPAGPPAGGQFAAGGGRVGAKGKTGSSRKGAPRRPAGKPKPAGPPKPLAFDGKTGTGYGVKGGDPRVRQLQATLNRLGLADSSGAELVLDGKYGPRTTSSVKKLQKALGVAQDGKVTPELLKQATELKQLPEKPHRKAAAKKPAAPARRAQVLAYLARALGEDHVYDDGVCVSCWLDRIDELAAALDELTMSRSWDSAAHPRNPKGSGGGGRFRSNVDKLKDALKSHKANKADGDPFEGFDREQLRRVAKQRGITLGRGEDRDSIVKKLMAHLDEEDHKDEPAAEPKAAAPKPEPKKRAPRKRAASAAEPVAPKAEPEAPKADAPKPAKKAAPRKASAPRKAAAPAPAAPAPTPAAASAYDGPSFSYSSERKRKLADELVALKAADMSDGYDYDRSERIARLEDEAKFTDAEHDRVYQLAQIAGNTERWRRAKAPETPLSDLQADMGRRSQEAWDGKPVAVRVTPNALKSILGAGRFKSQFETKRSGGLLDPKRRAEMEKRWFGLPENSDPAKRPIYGYLAVDGVRTGPAGSGALDQYGGIQVVLKDDVKSRTTAMWGDSLNIPDYGMPEPIGNPTWRSYALPTGGIGNGELKKLDRDVNSPDWRTHNYVETQIHGGVSTSDIAEVVLDKAPDSTLRDMLEGAGIPWRVS